MAAGGACKRLLQFAYDTQVVMARIAGPDVHQHLRGELASLALPFVVEARSRNVVSLVILSNFLKMAMN